MRSYNINILGWFEQAASVTILVEAFFFVPSIALQRRRRQLIVCFVLCCIINSLILLVLLLFRLLGSQGADRNRVGAKELVVSVQDNVGDGRQDSGHEGSEPVDKVMGGVLGEFAVGSDPKDVPGGREHRVHGGTGGREEFDESTNGNGRQKLFDNVVVFIVVDTFLFCFFL